jgi:serine/threonine-protein kinase
MAPEVLRGEPATPAADLYAVGALLFRMLTGRHPVEAETLDALRARHEHGERLALAALRPGLSPRFARILDRALAPASLGAAGERGGARAAAGTARRAGPRARQVARAAAIAAALVLAIGFAFAWLRRPIDAHFVAGGGPAGPAGGGDAFRGRGRGLGRGEAVRQQ